jgi:hypothetical protein
LSAWRFKARSTTVAVTPHAPTGRTATSVDVALKQRALEQGLRQFDALRIAR